MRYAADSGFSSPEHPVVLYSEAEPRSTSSLVRGLLSTAARELGRDIAWKQVYLGSDAVDGYGTAVPMETVEALESYRLGLLDPCSVSDEAATLEALRDELDLSIQVTPVSHLSWTPSPASNRGDVETEFFHGWSSRRPEVEEVVDAAVYQAFDRDRDTITVVEEDRGGQSPTPSFHDAVLEHLQRQHRDGLVSEEVYDRDYTGYPEDEVVVYTRTKEEMVRELLSNPGDYDVVLSSPGHGRELSVFASELVGGAGVTPTSYVGDGVVAASGVPEPAEKHEEHEVNPVALLRAASLLLKHLGWWDVAGVVEESVENVYSQGYVTANLKDYTERGEELSAEEFLDRVHDELQGFSSRDDTGFTSTSPEERHKIKNSIAGLYNLVFEDDVRAMDLKVNQIHDPEDEADIYLPEVGVNFRYWRRWSRERRVEVLLHEFAHVEDYEDGHGPEFYRRLVELTYVAEDWRSEIELLFDGEVDFQLVKRLVVESVHEDTVELDIESVERRQKLLRREFDLAGDDHY